MSGRKAQMDRTKIEAAARAIIEPLRPSDSGASYFATRTNAGRSLAPYYLVYFLLVELLGFRNTGQFEKVAWSLPVEYRGRQFTIEHRKFGLGIFSDDAPGDEELAREITTKINSAIRVAEPFFDDLANVASQGGHLNVNNNARELFDRFDYLANQYEAKRAEAERRKDEQVRTEITHNPNVKGWVVTFPAHEFRREAQWYAVSAIEAFFSWTEHVFILIAILHGNLVTGEKIAALAVANWDDKFRAALDLSDRKSKRFYDKLLVLRRQLRNFVAHGSFGKDGQAFAFHSPVGAVPLLLPHRKGRDTFRFGNGVDFVAHEAMDLVLSFVQHLWSDSRAPAKIYIQESGLPLILPHATDGTYAAAMESVEAMNEFVDHLTAVADRYANMDF